MRQGPCSGVAFGPSLFTAFQECAAICRRVFGQPSVCLISVIMNSKALVASSTWLEKSVFNCESSSAMALNLSLASPVQADSGMFGVADLLLNNTLLGFIELVPGIAITNGQQALIDGRTLLDPQTELHDFG